MDPSRSAYPNTILVFPGSGVDIDLRRRLRPEDHQSLQRLGLTEPFAVITACNPFGRHVSAPENVTRTEALARYLEEQAIAAIPADGVSPDRSHREEGFAVTIPLGDAVSIARRFEQTAVFWYDGEAFWIVESADPSQRQRLGEVPDSAGEG